MMSQMKLAGSVRNILNQVKQNPPKSIWIWIIDFGFCFLHSFLKVFDRMKNLTETSILDRVLTRIKHHLLLFYYYRDVVCRWQVYFNSPYNAKCKEVRVDKPPDIYGSLFFAGVYTFMIFAYLLIDGFNYKIISFALLIEMLPLYGRIYYLFVFLSWSILVILYPLFILKRKLLYYTLMAVLAVDDDAKSKIQPRHLGRNLWLVLIFVSKTFPSNSGLSDDQFRQFAKFRQRNLLLLNHILFWITLGANILQTFQAFKLKVIFINPYIIIFWLAFTVVWCLYVCASKSIKSFQLKSFTRSIPLVTYGVPILAFIISYYLKIKQQKLLTKMQRINGIIYNAPRCGKHRMYSFFWKFDRINCEYVRFYREVSDYNPHIKRALSVYMTSAIMVVSFCSFMLFLSNSTIELKFLFFQINNIHILFLSLTVFFCSKIPSGHFAMSHQYYTFHSCASQNKNLEWFHLLKVNADT